MLLKETINWDAISNSFTLDSTVNCLFITFALYVLYHYVLYQIRRFNTYQYLLELHSGNMIYNTESCPICLNEFKAPARLDCGHAFCMRCLLNCFKNSTYHWKCTCPLCRKCIQDFDCLYKFNFSKEEKAEIQLLEGQLSQLIKRQNYEIAFIERVIWLKSNKWKSITITVIIFTILIVAVVC